jgi:hypothetical protein
MKRSTFVRSAALALAVPLAVLPLGAAAADQPAVPAQPASSPSPAAPYDDPAMHFAPPAGWERIDLRDAPPAADEDAPKTVALYVKDRNEASRKTIVIEIGPFRGSLDDLASVHESDLRKKFDGVFIDRKARVVLANGMPAWWLRASYGSQLGHVYERYEYVVFDGRRSIVAAFTARLGEGGEKDAHAALDALSVVLYPRGR